MEKRLTFGVFVVDPFRRLLLREGRAIPLSSKAFDTLLAFLARPGQVLSRDELIAVIWPGVFVDENNLAQQVSTLRKALGEDAEGRPFIETVPRRGYLFNAQVAVLDSEPAPRMPSSPPTEKTKAFPVRNRKWIFGLLVAASLPILFWMGRGLFRVPRVEAIPVEMGLTTHGDADFPALSRDGKRMAYASGDPGAQEVWIQDLGGSERRRVFVCQGGNLLGLALSPGGDELFASRFQDGAASVVRIPLSGAAPSLFLRAVDGPLAFSPDGLRIAFRRVLPTDSVVLCVANADGSGERVLASRRYPAGFGWEGVAWSPDGTRIAAPVSSPSPGNLDWSLAIFRVSDGQESAVPGPRFLAAGQIVWDREGQGIYGLFSTPELPGRQLWHLPLAGEGAPRRITQAHDHHGLAQDAQGHLVTSEAVKHALFWKVPLGANASPPVPGAICRDLDSPELGLACLPDGSLLMGSELQGTTALLRMDAAGNLVPILDPSKGDRLPSSARDGRLAFVSRRNGNANVWVLDGPVKAPRCLTQHSTVRTPSLTPDGRTVFYDAPLENAWAIWGLWRVDVDEPTPRPFFTKGGRMPRVSPNGRWLGFNRWEEDQGRWRLAVMPVQGGEAVSLPATVPQDSALAWSADSRGLVYLDTRGGVSNLWFQPLDKGPARPLTRFRDERIFRFALSPDGAFAHCERGTVSRNLVRIVP